MNNSKKDKTGHRCLVVDAWRRKNLPGYYTSTDIDLCNYVASNKRPIVFYEQKRVTMNELQINSGQIEVQKYIADCCNIPFFVQFYAFPEWIYDGQLIKTEYKFVNFILVGINDKAKKIQKKYNQNKHQRSDYPMYFSEYEMAKFESILRYDLDQDFKNLSKERDEFLMCPPLVIH